MSSPQNPYRSSGSVGDSAAFVGRAELLGELSLALRRPERAAVIVGGGPGSGKTSLLDELRVQLSESGGLRAARFDPAPFAGAAVDDALVALAGQIAGALGVDAPARGTKREHKS
jgi:RecA/RadA recombinase